MRRLNVDISAGSMPDIHIRPLLERQDFLYNFAYCILSQAKCLKIFKSIGLTGSTACSLP